MSEPGCCPSDAKLELTQAVPELMVFRCSTASMLPPPTTGSQWDLSLPWLLIRSRPPFWVCRGFSCRPLTCGALKRSSFLVHPPSYWALAGWTPHCSPALRLSVALCRAGSLILRHQLEPDGEPVWCLVPQTAQPSALVLCSCCPLLRLLGEGLTLAF